MCIIAVQPIGKKIEKETLRQCWNSNSHGAGIMYVEDGKFFVAKEMDSFETLFQLYRTASSKDVAVVIHFRIATSGGINDYNLHPFKVSDDVWFCHNGILDITVPKDSKENDTQIFNNSLLKNLPDGFLYDTGIMNLIEYSIGTYNKFVFLDEYGVYHIVNEQAGTWDEGIWYSNKSYMQPVHKYNTRYYDKWEDLDYGWAKNRKYDSTKDAWDDEVNNWSNCDDCGNLIETDLLSYVADFNAHVCKTCLTELLEICDDEYNKSEADYQLSIINK